MSCSPTHDMKTVAIDKLTGRKVEWCERCGGDPEGQERSATASEHDPVQEDLGLVQVSTLDARERLLALG